MNQSIKAITNGKTAGKFAYLFFASLLILGGFQSVYAGGFQLAVQAPPSDYTHVKGAVLLVRTYGCHTPADANVTATAEGIVNGRRTSVPLELTPDEKGVYAITQQWQSEGTWILSFTGTYNGMTCTVFVDLADGGKVHPDTRIEAGYKKGTHARAMNRKPTTDDIEAALKSSGAVGQADAPAELRSGALMAGSAGAFLFLVGIAALAKKARSNRSKA